MREHVGPAPRASGLSADQEGGRRESGRVQRTARRLEGAGEGARRSSGAVTGRVSWMRGLCWNARAPRRTHSCGCGLSRHRGPRGPAPRGPRLSGAAVEGPERGRQRGTSCEVNAQDDGRVSGTDSKRVRVCPCSGPGGAQGERGKESTRITWHKTGAPRGSVAAGRTTERPAAGTWRPQSAKRGKQRPSLCLWNALETTNPGHPYSSALLSLQKFLREQPAQAATQEGLTAVGGVGSRSSCGPLAGLAASVCGSRSAARPLASSSLLCSCLS